MFVGISRFFKSFFDPLVELDRPVPPLAWAPLILTIFGITDDGMIFLLFTVAFAIMVISARTSASGTQLSKIRASHPLGASTSQIMWNVIVLHALPEILTGIRIPIGVCWRTLVAAEIVVGTTGVGFIKNVACTVSDYELILVTILIIGVLGLAFDLIMRWVIEKTIRWRGKGLCSKGQALTSDDATDPRNPLERYYNEVWNQAAEKFAHEILAEDCKWLGSLVQRTGRLVPPFS